MELTRIDKLRYLMGDMKFKEESRKGNALKAEEAEKRIKEAEAVEAAKLEEEERKAEEAKKSAPENAAETPFTSTIKVEYADMDEVLRKVRSNNQIVEKYAKGELAHPGTDFCPIVALSKFPYKYMDAQSRLSDIVSKGYFASEKFWNQPWSLFYIFPPISVSASPLILVPATEAGNFLQRINKDLNISLHINGIGKQKGLLIEFPDDGTPRPRYRGTSNSKRLYTSFETDNPKMIDICPPSTDKSFAAFKRKLEAAFEATKNTKKKSKQKKQQQRVVKKTDWSRQLRRTQRYLGLRETNLAEKKNAYFNAQTTEEQDAVHLGRALALEESAPKLNYNVAPLHIFDSDAVFVSVDVELYERGHSQITEIGIATLDSRDLAGSAPGQNASNWHDKVKARHFIIKEHSHLVNSEYVSGCPNKFEEQFGVSEEVSIKDAKSVVESCFQIEDIKDKNDTDEDSQVTSVGDGDKKYRTVILVGHDIEADISYLRKLELDITTLPGVLEVLDTANLYRTLQHMEQPTSLGNVLYNFEITGWNLHNAGNDAGYTLQALLAIAVSSLSSRPSTPTLEEQIEAAKKEAEERVRETAEEWEKASLDESDDGGAPLKKSDSESSAGKPESPRFV